jgi:hypothetical protein
MIDFPPTCLPRIQRNGLPSGVEYGLSTSSTKNLAAASSQA